MPTFDGDPEKPSLRKRTLGCLFAVPVLIVHMILIAIVRGLVLMKFWGWFIVPYFHVIPLTVPLALGFSCMVSVFLIDVKMNTPKINTEKSFVGQFFGHGIAQYFIYAIIYFYAWVLTWFL